MLALYIIYIIYYNLYDIVKCVDDKNIFINVEKGELLMKMQTKHK